MLLVMVRLFVRVLAYHLTLSGFVCQETLERAVSVVFYQTKHSSDIYILLWYQTSILW